MLSNDKLFPKYLLCLIPNNIHNSENRNYRFTTPFMWISPWRTQYCTFFQLLLVVGIGKNLQLLLNL